METVKREIIDVPLSNSWYLKLNSKDHLTQDVIKTGFYQIAKEAYISQDQINQELFTNFYLYVLKL